MLRDMKDMEGFAIGATDGHIGQVRDFYFDDESWVIRYFIVETGSWHSGRRVLISPMSIGQPNWTEKFLPAAITKEQIKNGPDIDTDKPVSRQHEMGYLGYYGYPNYWGGGGLWGAGFYPDILQGGLKVGDLKDVDPATRPRVKRKSTDAASQLRHQNDLHLRSANNVMRYYVHATDGDIGHVQGILVEEKTWAIRYLVVNTSNWWLGHEVLIAPEWIDHIFWEESKVVVALTRQAVKDAPPYDSKNPLHREQEKVLHAYYGHTGYWPLEAERDAKIVYA
jgi:uncharacterized protein YrrD